LLAVAAGAYGWLGAGIGMMMWVWISSIVILVGAQLNSEIEHQTARDSTVEQDKPPRRTRRKPRNCFLIHRHYFRSTSLPWGLG
jgi:uncharacterized BrkB/YihY/UPF0761 family membrane protein